MVVGHARHGKDTVCEELTQHGWTFRPTTKLIGELVVYPILKSRYGYQNFGECFVDRVNHRREWFDLIAIYNYSDPARLAKLVYETSDIYCGIRRFEELKEVKKQVDCLTIWVEAGKRQPKEGKSCTIEKSQADIILYNNGSRADLQKNIDLMVDFIERNVATLPYNGFVVEIDGVAEVKEIGYENTSR